MPQSLWPIEDVHACEVSSRRRKAPNANKLSPEDHPVHDWYRFILSYPPHLVRSYLDQFDVGRGKVVLDPFSGTGTTLVEAKKLGISSVGAEAHPMSHFAGVVKTDWSVDPDQLVQEADQIACRTTKQLAAADIIDQFDCQSRVNPDQLRTLPPDTAKLLLSNSISPLPLHKSLLLLDRIKQSDEGVRQHLLLALARALVTQIGNLHFGPEVGVGPAKSDAPVIAPWLAWVRIIADDLRQVKHQRRTPCRALRADARNLADVLEPRSIDAVICSPPYPNEKDYTRTTRLETVLLGFIHNKAQLQLLKRGLMRSNTRNVYKGDDDDFFVKEHKEIQRIARQIEARRIEMGKTSGFERMYHRVTRLYFGGMARHFEQLKIVLKPGARLAYVVGDQASYLRVMIRTGQLLADIAQSQGYEVEGIDLFRTRYATATRQELREEVVLLRWPG